ncbi:site-specific integrase [Dyella sp. AD56]|uniref:site-specific integrase n=1 Tax=Dyella sp. AD56 TaxID=1528744 RepID=UPI00130425B1|nr:site-specific integrase [Dyella sp. AD56]
MDALQKKADTTDLFTNAPQSAYDVALIRGPSTHNTAPPAVMGGHLHIQRMRATKMLDVPQDVLDFNGSAILHYPEAAPNAALLRVVPPVPTYGATHLRLSDRAAVFLSQTKQRNLSRCMLIDSLWTLRIFAELVGDKPLAEITHDDADAFLQALALWPPHASKRREYRLMAAPQVIAKAKLLGSPGLNLRTQQKHIDRLRTFFRWLEERGEIEPGLLKGVRLYTRARDFGRHRQPFSEENLSAIFDAHLDATCDAPHMFWAPLMGLYQGMRINEIGQLYVDDIQRINGTHCIDITCDRPGQRLKNRQSRRLLPIHPTLIDCGFLDFVKQARRWRRTTLFPGLSWGINGPGDGIGDWFNRTLLRKRCGICAPTLTFHSFRHCFATYGERSNVPDARLALLLGHSSGESILRMHYVKHASTAELSKDLNAIQFPKFGHGRYDPARFEAVFDKANKQETRPARLEAVYGPLNNR